MLTWRLISDSLRDKLRKEGAILKLKIGLEERKEIIR